MENSKLTLEAFSANYDHAVKAINMVPQNEEGRQLIELATETIALYQSLVINPKYDNYEKEMVLNEITEEQVNHVVGYAAQWN